MAAVEKFLFARDFAEEAPAAPDAGSAPDAGEAADASEAAAQPAPQAVYAEADLEQAAAEARQAAHAEGVAEGRRQAEAEAEAALTRALERTGAGLETLAGSLAQERERRDAEQLEVALQLVRRLFPALTRRHGLEEIEAVIRQSLDRLREEPRVVVRVADARLDALQERIDALTAEAGFDGKVVLLAEREIADGDVRVEWADGGAERDSARLWRDIEKAAERALQPPPASDDGAAGAEAAEATEADAGTNDPGEAEAPLAEEQPTDSQADASPTARRSA